MRLQRCTSLLVFHTEISSGNSSNLGHFLNPNVKLKKICSENCSYIFPKKRSYILG